MKPPAFNILLGAGFAVIAAFQPLIVLTTDKVALPSSTAWGLVFWGLVAVAASAYGRKKTEIACIAGLIAANPVMTKILSENDIEQRFNIRHGVEFGNGSILAWAGSICILAALLSKDKTEQPGPDKDNNPAA